jgi:hypothetical protein
MQENLSNWRTIKMATNTENRTARELESRETTQRKAAWTPPETLPSPKPQPGWVFRWIRTSMMGQADPTNTSAKFREGWVPVKATDHPELMLNADPNSRFKDNIEIGGLLLCKAPEEMVQQRREYYARQNQSQMEAVDNNFMKSNDERMPLFSEKRTTTSFGKGK